MGGKAFAYIIPDAPINVPRLSPETYQQVAAGVRSKLQTLFKQVAIPREAPGKADYGDIDFLVEGVRDENDKNIMVTVKELLGAIYHVDHSYAIRHPNVLGAYIQVDVELSKDGAGLFEWTKFMKNDSDLVQIIAILHRSIGLVCNDKGLHVRVEEVEMYDKKKSQVFLTKDPGEALDFYGYAITKYLQGFEDETEIFDWVTSGRFFSRKIYEDRIEKASDRVRKQKRPMYSRFMDEYMPTCRKDIVIRDQTSTSNGTEADQATTTQPTRQYVLQQALRTFDKQKEYDELIFNFETKEIEEAFWKKVAASIPQPQGSAMQGLKKWVAFRDGRPYIVDKPFSKSAPKPRWTEHFPRDALLEILAWVEENREQVRKLEEDRANEARITATKKK